MEAKPVLYLRMNQKIYDAIRDESHKQRCSMTRIIENLVEEKYMVHLDDEPKKEPKQESCCD